MTNLELTYFDQWILLHSMLDVGKVNLPRSQMLLLAAVLFSTIELAFTAYDFLLYSPPNSNLLVMNWH